jgi:hypothetical protein
MTLHHHAQPGPSAAQQPPQPRPQAPSQPPVKISHDEMDAAYAQGLVRSLGDTIGYAVHYQQTWWIRYEGGWIRTDPQLAELLDQELPLLAGQDQIIARNTQHRTRNPPGSGTEQDPA